MSIPTNKDIAEVTYNGVTIPLVESGSGDSVFNVEYGVTTFAEIKNASDAGQICHMKIDSRIYYLVSINSIYAFFLWTSHTSNRKYVTCGSDNVWSDETQLMVQLSDILDPENYFSTDTVTGALLELGAAKLNPITKTSAMTQAVGKDSNGALWTAPGDGGDSVFNVEYGVTTFAEIEAAYDSGKICRIVRAPYIYQLVYVPLRRSGCYFLYTSHVGKNRVIIVSSDNTWSEEDVYLQQQSINDSGNYFTAETVEWALEELGAAKLNPTTKTSTMTQAVGKDSNGMLWTEPSGGGGGDDSVFNVEYGVTTFAEIKDASDAGNVCQMNINAKIYRLTFISSSVAFFVWSQGPLKRTVTCTLNDTWSDELLQSLQLQDIDDPGNYFTTDTVEGALQEIGAALSGLGTLLGNGVIS